ncbi:prostaglandin-E synthase [Ranunculus cassubicifolius]
MSRHPELKWAQREDKLYITVLLSDAKDAKVHLEPEGTFTFSATAGGENRLYEIKLDLFDKVNVEESKINIGMRSIFCVVAKAENKWWNKLLRGDEKTPHFVKVDWDKWADEDDEGPEVDTSGMDFSKFGAGMEGMGDDGEDEDDTDDLDEVAKPEGETEAASKATEPSAGEKVDVAPST